METQERSILNMIGDMKGELGEFRGQLRELNHNMASISVKLDAISMTTAQNHDLPGQITDLKARVTLLEQREHERNGAMTFGSMLVKSPLFGMIVAAAAIVWAWVRK